MVRQVLNEYMLNQKLKAKQIPKLKFPLQCGSSFQGVVSAYDSIITNRTRAWHYIEFKKRRSRKVPMHARGQEQNSCDQHSVNVTSDVGLVP